MERIGGRRGIGAIIAVLAVTVLLLFVAPVAGAFLVVIEALALALEINPSKRGPRPLSDELRR